MFYKVNVEFILPDFNVLCENKFTGTRKYRKQKSYNIKYDTQYVIAKDKNEAIDFVFQLFTEELKNNVRKTIDYYSLYYEKYVPRFFEKIIRYDVHVSKINILPKSVQECTFMEVLENFKFSDVVKNV